MRCIHLGGAKMYTSYIFLELCIIQCLYTTFYVNLGYFFICVCVCVWLVVLVLNGLYGLGVCVCLLPADCLLALLSWGLSCGEAAAPPTACRLLNHTGLVSLNIVHFFFFFLIRKHSDFHKAVSASSPSLFLPSHPVLITQRLPTTL